MNVSQKHFYISLLLAMVGFWPGLIVAKTRIIPSNPVNLKIPRIGLNAPVEARGLTAGHLMQPPTSSANAVWDRTGVIPGQPGEAVLYGHLTDNHFGPALFINLNKLKVDDKIIVTDAKGTVQTFKVTKKKTIRSDRITYFDISRNSKFIHLNLYTCAGKWLPSRHQYSHYLVVYTTIVSSVPK